MKKLESGSLHMVIIAILGAGLIVTLGLLFYQNVLIKDNDSTVTTSSELSKNKSENTTALKSYCTDKEMLCFEYPNTWKIEKLTTDESAGAEKLSVTSEDGQLTLEFIAGISGIGSCCGPAPEGPVTIVSAERANSLTELGKNEYLSERADGAYVSEVITSDVTASYSDPSDLSTQVDKINGYIPQLILHNAAKLVAVQTYKAPNGGVELLNVMPGKNAIIQGPGSQGVGSMVFGTVPFESDKKQKLFKSIDEAEMQFTTRNYREAKQILLTAHYK
jgi:hypothetical protein